MAVPLLITIQAVLEKGLQLFQKYTWVEKNAAIRHKAYLQQLFT